MIENSIREWIAEAVHTLLTEKLSEIETLPAALLRELPEISRAADLAPLLNVSVNQIWNACKRSEIPHVHLGSQILFVRLVVIRWLLTGESVLCNVCGSSRPPGAAPTQPSSPPSPSESTPRLTDAERERIRKTYE